MAISPENLISKLKKEGFAAWADSVISAGEEWRTAIDLAIRDSFALIAVMTPEAKASEYVTYEWAFAWGVGIRVIPVMLRWTELHPRLEGLQYLDFTSHTVRPWARLMEEVRNAASAPIVNSVSVPLNSPPLVRRAVAALDSANSRDRTAAVETLVAADMPAARGVLSQAIKHPGVRRAAVEVLGRVGGPSVVEAVTGLVQDLDPGVRRAAVEVLGRDDRPSVVETVTGLVYDPDPGVRKAAVEILGRRGGPEYVAAVPGLLDETDPEVKEAIAAVLRRMPYRGGP
jgi:hypothetical protein